MRPLKDLALAAYPASSSLRAWTLRLPSVVSSSFFSSLKVRESLTASALSIPRRRRSWTSRSSLGASPTTSSRKGRLSRSRRAVFCLAAIFHRDHDAEDYVQAYKTGGQQHVIPAGQQQGDRPDQHEAGAHQGHHPNRRVAARNNCGAIKQQPDAGQKARNTGPEKHGRQDGPGQHRRRKARDELAPRAGKKGQFEAPRF